MVLISPPRWDLFAGVAVLLVLAMLALARATQRTLAGSPDGDLPDADVLAEDGATAGSPPGHAEAGGDVGRRPIGRPGPAPVDFGTGLLLANVIVSHGLLGTFLLATAWYAEVPLDALGLDGALAAALLPGIALGGTLSLASEAAARLADRVGIEYDEHLRELLAPDTLRGWIVLLVVVLPIVAGVEELLFRGALIGALAAGYDLPVWGLAAASSVLFGLGHGLQGSVGVVVTAALGFVLAAVFVLTGSLWVVVVAHYVVNAVEFVVHEGVPRSSS